MAITAQQARAELARRELAKRELERREQPQPQQDDIRASKMIPQFTKGLYENLPFGKRILSMLPNAQAIQQNMASTPQAQGFLPQFASGLGSVAPDLAMSTPFMGGAGALRGLPGIAKTALGFGAYGGTKAAVQGQPILPAAASSAGSAALFHGAGKLGASLIPSAVPFAERIGAAIGGGVAGGLTGGEEGMALGTGLGALYPAERLKIAESVVSYALKPNKSTKKYGANPVKAIVKEGIFGKNWQETFDNAQLKIDKLMGYRDQVKLQPQNIKARVNFVKSKVFEPINELINTLKRDPDYHSGMIKDLEAIVKSLSKDTNLNDMNIEQAFALKDRLNKMKPKGIFSIGESFVNNALRETSHNMKEAINSSEGVSPELRNTNKRIQDLISAKDAIFDAKNRNSPAWNLIPLSMFGYGLFGGQPWLSAAVAGRAALKTPAVATGISKVFGGKYPKTKVK